MNFQMVERKPMVIKKRSQIIFALFVIYFLCISIYNPEIYGFNLSNYILLIVAFTSVAILRTVTHIKKGLFLAVLFLYIVFTISAIQSDSYDGWILFIKLTIPVFCAVIASKTMKEEVGRNMMAKAFAVVNVCACITGIINYYVFRDQGYTMLYMNTRIGRMRGSFLQPNVFATFLVVTLPFSFFCFLGSGFSDEKIRKKRTKFLLLIMVLALNVFCIYMARSRWSMLTMALLLVWCPFVITKKNSKKNILLALGCTILVVTSMSLFLYFSSNATAFFGYRWSNDIRKRAIIQAFELADSNNFWGLGLAHGIGSTLDSTIMNLLVDTGLIGMLLFLGICIYCLICLFRNSKCSNRAIDRAFCLMFIGFCIEMIGESVLYNSLLNCFMGIIWYLCAHDFQKKGPDENNDIVV